MKITIVTLFPAMIQGFLNESILKRAQEKGVIQVEIVNLREFALDSYGTVDDRPYGGGAGMVLRVEPIVLMLKNVILSKSKNPVTKSTHGSFGRKLSQDDKIVKSKKNGEKRIILTSAKGKTFNQAKVQELAKLDHLIIIAGHYEGVDERVMEYVDEEISIGDFILTGGEIPAAAIADSVVRLIPGVLKKDEATQEESFFEVSVGELIAIVGATKVLLQLREQSVEVVRLLEYPQYTRPEEFEKMRVPDELLSGDHERIRRYKIKKAYEETVQKRPDLLDINKE